MKEEFGSLFRLRGHSRKTSLWLIHSSTDPVCGHRKESKRREKRERKHQTSALFHAPAVEKETAKSGWVCAASSLCCPRLVCDSLQSWWDPMGAGSGFTNLPVSARPTRASNLVVTWGGEEEGGVCVFVWTWVESGTGGDDNAGGRLLGAVEAAARGKLLGRSSKCAKCAHKGIKVERWRKAHYLSFLAKNSRY